MRLLRVGDIGQEKVAALDDDNIIRDLSSHIKDLNPETINFDNLKKLDYEVELALVIGKEAKNVSEDKALDYVFGYFILNDISDRHVQKIIGSGHWTLGKSWCAPAGGLLVTKEHIKDINDINLTLSVNGEIRQNGNTKNMIFKVSFLIAHISKYLTLKPGTVISTGTPAGTGMEQKPQKFLQVGDELHLKVDHLGEQNYKIIGD